MLGLDAPVYLLKNDAGTTVAPGQKKTRTYAHHWSPIHPDIAVDDLDTAIANVLAAGARLEAPATVESYGHIAVFADPSGHGFCLIEFNEVAYDAIVE